ncbi:DBH-like monooxygenase protein 1 [Orchesella cincta]|uniref:DBH-like monooxygenase protein 1 n=1 Tax=Orchesella cincta TaxID=48709 RepID=A0A1D2NI78_ORCCI|nr:DBH-like monooxygenase protein 1 [Orchesella cincta]
MIIPNYFLFLLLAAVTAADVVVDGVLKNYSDKQFLDFKNRYFLEWNVDWIRKQVLFNVSVATSGWVGIGLSKDGTMKNADIVIAGVSFNGKPYISDFHTDCDRNLLLDAKQDWRLLGARETLGRTSLQLSRPIDTCDSDDHPITEDLLSIIWAYGETDQLEYHNDNRGRFRVYLLDPVLHPAPTAKSLPRWKVSTKTKVPPKETTYWCTIHKIPPGINRKHHIIEFHPVLENEVAVGHVHHFLLWRCQAPKNADPRLIFEHLVSYPGEECYFNDNHQIPINLCRTMMYVYAVGGQGIIVPGDTGYPFGEFPYYMLETHYNNPEKINGLQFEAGVELVYTNRLRSNDGGTFLVGYDLLGLFMVPPASPNFDIQSHCDNRCTSEMIPARGIEIFAAQGHTHGSGRKMKLHHFRGGKELPWIYKDENYDWTFQTTRPLQTERKVLPGDHLTMSCSYDNTWTNTTTPSGFASRDEMCLTTIYHKTPIPYYTCSGQIPQETLLRLVGVQDVTWDQITQRRVVTSPPALSGKTLAEITDRRVFWSKQLRATIAAVTVSSPQVIACPITTPPEDEPVENVVILARGYGDQTLMGPTPVPVRTPGPHSVSGFPYSNKLYARVRNCPAH